MKLVASIAIVCLGAIAVGAQSRDATAPPRQIGTAVLSGRVVRETTPIARAIIRISADDGRTEYETATDDSGRFSFDRLPAGRYLVRASRRGWVTTFYGSPRPGYPPGIRVALENGGKAAIEIPILPGSVIAGRIVHDDGRAMARQFPWLLETRLVGNRRMIARARMPYDVGNFERQTNDRGEFRLFGLPPGTYYLAVTPSITAGARQGTSDGPIVGYAQLFYPGTADPRAAQPIVVGPGEVREGLTFRIGYVPVARVSGVVRRQDGTPAALVTVTMRHREMTTSLEGSDRLARTDAEGRFTYPSVPPGDFRVIVRAAGPTADGRPALPNVPPLLWGQADVFVNGTDIDGLGISLAPGAAISGRITFEGTSLRPPDNLTTIRLTFIPTEALAMAQAGAGSAGSMTNAAVQADGTFRAEGLPPDRYLIAAQWPGMRTGDGSTGWWLTTIRVGTRDLGDAPIEVEANKEVRDVGITFRDRIGIVEGLLMDATGRPAPGYYVLAFPTDRASWTSTSRRAVKPVRPGTDGAFRLAGLLAGEYYLAVVTAVDDDDATDPAFLEPLVPSAIKISVGAGETRRQDLRIGR